MCNNKGRGPKTDANSHKICKSFHKRRMDRRVKDAKLIKAPLMISEFGACFDSDVCVREINDVMDQCDEGLASWAYWQFK